MIAVEKMAKAGALCLCLWLDDERLTYLNQAVAFDKIDVVGNGEADGTGATGNRSIGCSSPVVDQKLADLD